MSKANIKALLEDHIETVKEIQEKEITSRIPGVFMFGVMTGVVISYSGLLGVVAGMFLGVTVNQYYGSLTDKIMVGVSELINRRLYNGKG